MDRSEQTFEGQAVPPNKRQRVSDIHDYPAIAPELQSPIVENQDGQRSQKRKFSPETPDYPRRRATIACEICRSRKSRCDGNKPKCRLCRELNAECVYREPGVKLDAGDKMILERLDRIEGMLHSTLMTRNSVPAPSSAFSPAVSNGSTLDDRVRSLSGTQGTVPFPLNGLGTWPSEGQNISTMPKIHTTPALHLLQWPVIRDLITEPCSPQTLLRMELSRPSLRLPPDPQPDMSETSVFVQAFFEQANIWYACVNPYTWHDHYRNAAAYGFREGAESCMVLLVIALGCAALSGSVAQTNRSTNYQAPGLTYFAAAWKTLPGLVTRNDMLSIQCHVLAAAYLFYLVRPVEAWNLLMNASMKLQLWSSIGTAPDSQIKETYERLFWNTLLFESDLLAELDLPHSGIVNFEEATNLPMGFKETGTDPAGRDEPWYFLAEIALRRLLNRVSHLIYTKTSSVTNISAVAPVVQELDRQLTQWYEKLPPDLQFPRSRLPTDSFVQTVLRLRYFACRTIIFRPYIQAVLSDESAALDPVVSENCKKCLEACIRQINRVAEHQAGHLPYLWQGALSIVSQTLLVMGATMCPPLAALLPAPESMDRIIEDVVVEINRISHLAPSLQLSAQILRDADERRRRALLGRGHR